MKQAKVKRYRRRQMPFGMGWDNRALVRVGIRLLLIGLPLLPFIAVAIVFMLPETPHLRVSYTYTGSHEHPNYRTCQYLGIHGFSQVIGQDCPLVAFIEGKF